MPIHSDIELPGSVIATDGEGGLPALRVTAPSATGELYLHGAHVTAWTPAGHEPVLWMSEQSRFAPDAPIRGGVPICFPWFGPGRSGEMSPAHGYARLADWTLVDVLENSAHVSLVLRLTDHDVADHPARKQWPHRFEALYTATFGEALELSLAIRNTGEEEYSFEEALHSYLAVRDIRSTEVTGLEGAAYLDKVSDETAAQDGPVTFSGETDLVYRSTSTATVSDGARTIAVAKEGSASTVVWNPWADKAHAMPDYGDDEWPGMVCVETANALDDVVVLRAGQRHTMRARLSVRR